MPEDSTDSISKVLQDGFRMWLNTSAADESGDDAIRSGISEYIIELSDALDRQCTELASAQSPEHDASEWAQTHHQLARLRNRYEIEGEPLALIEAFLVAVQEFGSVPGWVLIAMHERLGTWYEADGVRDPVTLDAAFQVKIGRSGTLQREREKLRDGALCFEMYFLQSIAPKMAAEDAAALVGGQYWINDADLPMISASTLKDRYDKIWRRRFQGSGIMKEICEQWQQLSIAERRAFLSRYKDGGLQEAEKYFPSLFRRPCSQCDQLFDAHKGQITCLACQKLNATLAD